MVKKHEAAPAAVAEAPALPVVSTSGKLTNVKLADIGVTGWNPRLTLGTEAERKTLVTSLEVNGFDPAFPIMVGTLDKSAGSLAGKLVVLRGHRRLDAMQAIVKSGKLGRFNPDMIPAINVGTVSAEAAKRLIIDHTTRPLSGEGELMRAVQNLSDSGMTQHQIGDFLRLGRGKVQQLVEMAKFPPETKAAVLDYYRLRAEGSFDPDNNPAQPVFNQALLQRLRAANNARIGVGKSVDGKPADPHEFEQVWKEWQKDKGRTLTGDTNGPKPLTHKEALSLRARIADYAKPEFKDVLLNLCDVFLRTKNPDAVSAYLNQ